MSTNSTSLQMPEEIENQTQRFGYLGYVYVGLVVAVVWYSLPYRKRSDYGLNSTCKGGCLQYSERNGYSSRFEFSCKCINTVLHFFIDEANGYIMAETASTSNK